MTQVASLIAELEAGRFPARRRWRTPALWVGCGFLVVTGSSALLIYRHNPPSLRPPPTKLASPAGPTPVVPPGPPPNADSPVATAQRPLAAPTEVAKDALTLLAPPLITIPAKPAAAKNRAEHRRTGRAPPAASDPPLQAAQQPPAASGRTGLIERTPEFE